MTNSTSSNSSGLVFADYEQAKQHVLKTEQSQTVRFVHNNINVKVYLHYLLHRTGGDFVFADTNMHLNETPHISALYEMGFTHLMN